MHALTRSVGRPPRRCRSCRGPPRPSPRSRLVGGAGCGGGWGGGAGEGDCSMGVIPWGSFHTSGREREREKYYGETGDGVARQGKARQPGHSQATCSSTHQAGRPHPPKHVQHHKAGSAAAVHRQRQAAPRAAVRSRRRRRRPRLRSRPCPRLRWRSTPPAVCRTAASATLSNR